MVKEIQYTNIRRILDNLTEHPMLREITLEQVVRYTMRFISLHGYPKLYQTREAVVDIEDFRGILPCDLISIIQVKDEESKVCLRAMTDSFTPGMDIEGKPRPKRPEDPMNNLRDQREDERDWYLPPMRRLTGELAFKTQGRVIYTSFPHGRVLIAYKAVPVDEDGFPLLLDNENYLAALEAYIKKQVFTIKFDQGKIAAGILQNAQRDYAVLAGELQSEMLIPSVSEAEALTRYYNSLIPRVREFDRGFREMGNREYLKRH